MPEIGVLIHPPHIAGVIPSVTHGQGGLFEVVEITFHNVIALDQDLPDFPKPALLSGLIVLNANPDAGKRLANAPGAVELRRINGDDERCLRGAVTLQEDLSMLVHISLAKG